MAPVFAPTLLQHFGMIACGIGARACTPQHGPSAACNGQVTRAAPGHAPSTSRHVSRAARRDPACARPEADMRILIVYRTAPMERRVTYMSPARRIDIIIA